jgi:hypothetical protein
VALGVRWSACEEEVAQREKHRRAIHDGEVERAAQHASRVRAWGVGGVRKMNTVTRG